MTAEESRQINHRLDILSGKLDKVSDSLSVHMGEHRSITQQIDELRDTVYGNGTQGLKADMAELKVQRVISQKWLGWAIGLCSGVASGVIIAVVQALIK